MSDATLGRMDAPALLAPHAALEAHLRARLPLFVRWSTGRIYHRDELAVYFDRTGQPVLLPKEVRP